MGCALLATTSAGAADGSLPVPEPLPKSADLRPAFTNWGLPLRLQGGRGTCSVFTMTGAIEYGLARKHQQPGAPLSVEFLNWASNEATQEKEDGSFFSDLWTGFTTHGICRETNMPYQPSFDAARRPDAAALRQAHTAKQAGLRLHWIKPWDVKTGLTDDQFAEIKRVIARQWPVCGGFRWPKQERWPEGVLEMATPENVFDGHSVLLVGFRDAPDEPGGGVFLVRNTGSGLHDAALRYDYVRAYMNDAAWVDSSAEPAAGKRAWPGGPLTVKPDSAAGH